MAGLWSRTPERARAEAERLDIAMFTTDAEALITSPDIDAVAVHSPPATHRDFCQMAFDAGKHVLCDKPFAMNADEAREMKRAADASGVTSMINFELRFEPLRLQIKDILARGDIGVLRHATVELDATNPLIAMGRPWRLDPRHGGGLLNELGSHYLDMLRQWFGDLTSISARLESFPPPDIDAGIQTEDWLSATCTFARGGLATLTMSWVADPPHGSRIVIVGSEGSLTAHSSDAMLAGGTAVVGRRGEADVTPVQPAADQIDATASGVGAASQRLISVFGEGIDSGISPAPNFDDAQHSQNAIDAMRQSSKTQRTVELPCA